MKLAARAPLTLITWGAPASRPGGLVQIRCRLPHVSPFIFTDDAVDGEPPLTPLSKTAINLNPVISQLQHKSYHPEL